MRKPLIPREVREAIGPLIDRHSVGRYLTPRLRPEVVRKANELWRSEVSLEEAVNKAIRRAVRGILKV